MPVTVKPAAHPSRKWTRSDAASSAESLLQSSCPNEYRCCKSIVQSSFGKFSASQAPVYPDSNGFVRAAVDAYSGHYHLTIRPEDIWFAILTQLSFFVKAHAEELRSFFVPHEGRKELVVKSSGTIHTADFGWLARRMTGLIADNVIDPELRTWIMPEFSTTTDEDMVVASILMMGAMQKYFTYTFELDCGIPCVTLLGNRADWENILSRLEKLPQLGPEPTQFYTLLKPVLAYFVLSFDSPSAPSVIDFWQRIAHYSGGGSGPTYLSGWITAFCFWEADGKSLYAPYGSLWSGPVDVKGRGYPKPGCDLDGTLYHRVTTNNIPAGYASVPVTVNDNGHIHYTIMVAGSVGIRVTSSGDALDEANNHSGKDIEWEDHVYVCTNPTGEPGPDSLQPALGWWMYETEEQQSGESETGKPKIKRGGDEQLKVGNKKQLKVGNKKQLKVGNKDIEASGPASKSIKAKAAVATTA